MTKVILAHIAGTAARILTAVLLLATLIGAWAGYINPHTWALPSIVCLIFPELWIALLVAGVLWLVCAKEKISACVCGVALLITIPQLLNSGPINFPNKPDENETTLKLLTYNVAGYRDIDGVQVNHSRTLSYILNSDADIVCMQEFYGINSPRTVRTKITKAQIDSLNSIYPYSIVTGNVEDCVYSRYPVKLLAESSSRNWHFFNHQLYEVQLPERKITILNVHLPSYELSKGQKKIASELKHDPGSVIDKQSSKSLYRKLRTAFEKRALAAERLAAMIDSIPGPLIVCGDFNDVPNSYAWRTIKNAGLDDAYLEAGLGPMITFNANHFLFHIDQVLYRPDQGMRAYKVERGKLRSSDHYPVSVWFAISK